MPITPEQFDRLSATPKTSRRLAFVAVVFVVFIICLTRFQDPDFQRHVELDELITLQNYTWLGVRADGTSEPLLTTDDLRRADRCSVRRFLIGYYCSVGRWPEPNNHIVHSLLTDVSLLLAGYSAATIRVPALLAAGLFGMIMACYALRAHVWFAAPLIAALSLCHPHLVLYSQSGRGYALVLIPVAAMPLLLEQLRLRPRSRYTTILLITLALLAAVTMVNLVADWVVPFYAAALLVPVLARRQVPARDRSYRRAIAAQVGVIGPFLLLFVSDRLPYLASSAQQYGLPFHSLDEGMARALELLKYLFPSAGWSVLGVLGCWGLVSGLMRSSDRVVALPLAASAAFSVAHFLGTARFPYARGIGFLLPAILAGYVFFLQDAVRVCRTKWAHIAVLAASSALTIWALAPGLDRTTSDPAFEALAKWCRSHYREPEEETLLLLGEGVGSHIRLDLPHAWATDRLTAGNGETIRVVTITRTQKPLGHQSTEPDRMTAIPPSDWTASRTAFVKTYEVAEYTTTVHTSQPGGVVGAIALWQPALESVTVTPELVEAALKKEGLTTLEITGRYQAKLEIFGRLALIVVPMPNASAKSGNGATTHQRRVRGIERMLRDYGGELRYLVPASLKDHSSAEN